MNLDSNFKAIPKVFFVNASHKLFKATSVVVRNTKGRKEEVVSLKSNLLFLFSTVFFNVAIFILFS